MTMHMDKAILDSHRLRLAVLYSRRLVYFEVIKLCKLRHCGQDSTTYFISFVCQTDERHKVSIFTNRV
jgi:hypothetical protein